MNLRGAITLGHIAEKTMQRMYQRLGAMGTCGNERLAALWRHMATAEHYHAAVFDSLLEGMSLAELDREVELSVEPLNELVEAIDGFCEQLETATPALDDIFRFVLAIETGEQNGVLLEMLQHCPPEFAEKIADDLATPGRYHIRPILDAVLKLAHGEDLHARVREIRAEFSSATQTNQPNTPDAS